MSILTHISNIFTKKVDGYAFEKTVYSSITDYIHNEGIIVKSIYIPRYDIYAHYYSYMKEFISYKLDKPFDENNKDYYNVRKIKISISFCEYLCNWYKLCMENKKWSEQNKQYFDDITK
jgi:hypothetical protein